MSQAATQVFEAAAAHHRAGRLLEAREVLSSFLEAHGGDSEAHFRLALVLADLGELPLAEREARSALGLSPRGAYAFLLGDLLERQGRTGEARESLRQSLALDPRLAAAHSRLAEIEQREGRLSEAEHAYRTALALRPQDVRILNNLSVLLLARKSPAAAAEFARRVLALVPDHAQAHFNLARAQHALANNADALLHADRAIAFDAANADAHELRGVLLVTSGQLALAAQAFESALAIAPDLAAVWNRLASTRVHRGLVAEGIEAWRRAVACNPPEASAIHSNILFAMQYDGSCDMQEVFAEHCAWAERYAPLRPAAPFANDRGVERKLRIGYLSPRFQRSSAVFLLEPVLHYHDALAVEVFCYSAQDQDDDVTQRLRARATWRDVSVLDDAALVAAIRADRIDILVDLAGHTPGHRLTALAEKPAPVVMLWLDYFNTTGLASVDYLVSDAVHSPTGDMQPFVEEVIRLPRVRFCYGPPGYAPPVEPLRARKDGEVVFGSFARMAKISPETLEAWGAVVKRVPKSRFLLKNSALDHPGEHAAHRDRFQRVAGIAPERLELRGTSKHDAMLAEYADIDVALDTFPYNGGLTTLEALYMGRPVVAKRGASLIARQSAALLNAMGLSELVARDTEHFVDIAEALALDVPRRERMAAELRGRLMDSPVGKSEAFTRDLEQLYRGAWRRWSETCR